MSILPIDMIYEVCRHFPNISVKILSTIARVSHQFREMARQILIHTVFGFNIKNGRYVDFLLHSMIMYDFDPQNRWLHWWNINMSKLQKVYDEWKIIDPTIEQLAFSVFVRYTMNFIITSRKYHIRLKWTLKPLNKLVNGVSNFPFLADSIPFLTLSKWIRHEDRSYDFGVICYNERKLKLIYVIFDCSDDVSTRNKFQKVYCEDIIRRHSDNRPVFPTRTQLYNNIIEKCQLTFGKKIFNKYIKRPIPLSQFNLNLI